MDKKRKKSLDKSKADKKFFREEIQSREKNKNHVDKKEKKKEKSR